MLLERLKHFFKSLMMRTAAKFKTIKNRHLRICCIVVNKSKTTVSVKPKKIPIMTLFKPRSTDFPFHFQMCSLIPVLNCTFRYKSLEEKQGSNARL